MNFVDGLLGLGNEAKELTVLQVSARALLVFLYLIVLVRIGDKRFLSRKSAVDVVLGFLLASMIARAVNGSAAFVPTLVAGLVIVLLHRVLAHACVNCHWLGGLIKGHSELVIEDGQVNEERLRRHNFTEADMLEDLRLRGVASPEQVEMGHIERNGALSVVKRK